MGIAASLFFTNEDTENSLSYRIRPSEEQRESQQERWNDLRDVLLAELGEKSGYILSSWLQGSYKFGTQIRPATPSEEFDIDLGIYFNWVGEHSDGRFEASSLKDFVQDVLCAYAEDQGNETSRVSEPKERCNRIHFDDGFHIDVPSYHLDPSRDLRGLATSKNHWEESDPKAIYLWWKNSLNDAQRSRSRRLVRYLKMWSAINIPEHRRPSSILLTVLACEAFPSLDEGNTHGDDEYLLSLSKQILDRLEKDNVVSNPVNQDENLNRLSHGDSAQLVGNLRALVSIAERALAAQSKSDSADIWSEIFGHFFPFPEENDDKSIADGSAVAVMTFDPMISIIARAAKREFRGVNTLCPIPKGCTVRFELMNADTLPFGASVSWVVRNSGGEAESENDLGHRSRNEFFSEESTAYKGDHFMDVSVHLNGATIGRRRVCIKVTGLGLPLRNPRKRAWVALG